MIHPNVAEFKKFYSLLMAGAPQNYTPWLFALEQQNKDPLGTRQWSNIKNRLSYEGAIRFLKFGFNIGISARDGDPLVLIDVDDPSVIKSHDIKPTLSVDTRSGVGSHHFYFSNDKECNVNIPTDVGEIRSCNQYLVVSGSYVPTDTPCAADKEHCGYYTVANHVPPSSIEFSEFPKVFRDHHDMILHEQYVPRSPPTGRKSKSALFDLTVTDIVCYPKHKKRFASVFHGSATGSNTAVSGNLLHCWRHLCSHSPVQILAVMAGLYTCQQAGESHKNGGSGKSMLDTNDGESMYRIWDYARSNGLIPKDDTPPSSALTYFVSETGLCNPEEIEDGWRLPRHAYVEGLRLLKTNI